jgi:hypothetical protein
MASKEVKSSLTTDRVTWGAIPHPLGERGKRGSLTVATGRQSVKQGEMRKSLDLDQVVSATQVPTVSASERSMNRRYSERANAR